MRWTHLLILSCASPPPDDPPPLPEPEVPELRLDARPTEGARLWIDGRATETRATVDLWGSSIGPILGIAATLEIDPTHVTVSSAELGPEVLGAGAASLLRVETGRVVFGLARRGPQAGEASIDEPTLIARVEIDALGPGESRVGVERVLVRRADGAIVPLGTFGAIYSSRRMP